MAKLDGFGVSWLLGKIKETFTTKDEFNEARETFTTKDEFNEAWDSISQKETVTDPSQIIDFADGWSAAGSVVMARRGSVAMFVLNCRCSSAVSGQITLGTLKPRWKALMTAALPAQASPDYSGYIAATARTVTITAATTLAANRTLYLLGTYVLDA